jgi:hypothetical protein
VEVVDHQNHWAIRLLEVVQQGGDHIGRHLAIEAQELESVLTELAPTTTSSRRFYDRSHEPNRIVVGRIAVQPSRWLLGLGRQPVGQKSALACSGRAHNQGQVSQRHPVELVEKPRPMDQTGRNGRRAELG